MPIDDDSKTLTDLLIEFTDFIAKEVCCSDEEWEEEEKDEKEKFIAQAIRACHIWEAHEMNHLPTIIEADDKDINAPSKTI